MAIDELPLADEHAGRGATTAARERGLWRDAFRQTLRKRSALIGPALLGLLLFLAVFAPLLAPYGPNEVLLDTEGLRPDGAVRPPG